MAGFHLGSQLLVGSPRFSTSAISGRSFTISFKIAGTKPEIHTETFASPKRFQEMFQGFRFMHPNTGFTCKPEHLLEKHTDPSVIYIAKHPFLVARMEEIDHNQISDKAFEDKACAALERRLLPIKPERRLSDINFNRSGAWRILSDDKGRDVAEWEGIWQCKDGHTFFLEAKRVMDVVSFYQFYVSIFTYTCKG